MEVSLVSPCVCLYRANQLTENLHEHNKMKIFFLEDELFL